MNCALVLSFSSAIYSDPQWPIGYDKKCNVHLTFMFFLQYLVIQSDLVVMTIIEMCT